MFLILTGLLSDAPHICPPSVSFRYGFSPPLTGSPRELETPHLGHGPNATGLHEPTSALLSPRRAGSPRRPARPVKRGRPGRARDGPRAQGGCSGPWGRPGLTTGEARWAAPPTPPGPQLLSGERRTCPSEPQKRMFTEYLLRVRLFPPSRACDTGLLPSVEEGTEGQRGLPGHTRGRDPGSLPEITAL